MKTIFIEPIEQCVREYHIPENRLVLNGVLSGRAEIHQIVEDMFPDHEGWVDADALVNQKPVWWLNGVAIWGAMILCGKNRTDVSLSIEAVSERVAFSSLDTAA